MGEKLAVRGGRKVVPDGLKVKWPEITREKTLAVNVINNVGIIQEFEKSCKDE